MKYIIILLVLFSTYSVSYTQEEGDSEIAKAVLLFYVSNLIEWPADDTVSSFNIGVQSKETSFSDELKEIAKNYTVHNKPIVIKSLDEYEDPENIHVIFVDKSYHNDIDEILNYCQEHQILQVTDRLENKRYTVINFVKDKKTNNLGYEVNKANLTATNLNYQDELLLYGGSLKDLRDLYNVTKELLENETDKVIELSKDLIKKNNELSVKTASIDSLTTQIIGKRDTLSNLLVTIDEQTESIQKQRSTYTETKNELQHIQKQYLKQLNSIKEKEDKVSFLDSAIQVRENIILTQSNEIEIKDSTIEARNRTVLLLIFLGSTIFLLGLLIYRAYFMKKRNNRLLEEKVAKRSGEIIKMNKDLQSEILSRKKFESELVKSERNYREIFNATTDAICIYSIEGEIIDVNQAMLNIYGYNKYEYNRLSFKDICFKEGGNLNEIALAYFDKAIRLGKIEFDSQARRKSGEVFWVEVALLKTNIAGNNCILSVIRDIDDKKKNTIELESYRLKLEQMVDNRTIELKEANIELNTTNQKLKCLNKDLENQKQELNLILQQLKHAQGQLVDSEKMAAIGTMAAGVAHEINNPLNYIKGGVFGIKTVLEEHLKDNSDVAELMDGIDLGVDRAAKIVSSLNHFSRQSEILNEACDIHTIIENCIAILQHTIKFRIEIEKDYTKIPLVCQGNEGKIHQVILNIITNATQAIENEGKIWITTGELKNENKVFVQIRDSGSGIDPEIIDKVTTPFYTTKDVGKGTGLGLSISKKIISDHKGELLIKSELNNGTTILIYLPLIQHDS